MNRKFKKEDSYEKAILEKPNPKLQTYILNLTLMRRRCGKASLASGTSFSTGQRVRKDSNSLLCGCYS